MGSNFGEIHETLNDLNVAHESQALLNLTDGKGKGAYNNKLNFLWKESSYG